MADDKKKKSTPYRQFLSERMKELTSQGMSGSDAMKQVAAEWNARKAANNGNTTEGGKMRETKMKGGLQTLRLELPLVVEANPDLAALWDVAEGVIDFLQLNARGDNDRQAFVRRAAAAFARAKGEASTADGHEYRMGEALGEVLLLVMAHRGLTADDWVSVTPPQLGQPSGVISGATESVSSLLGIQADVNDDGIQTSTGDLVGGVVEAAAETVLDLFDQ